MRTETTDRPRAFVIYAPSFCETNGGAILLHLLAQRLNEAGETALIWPMNRPVPRLRGNPRRWLGLLRYILSRKERDYSTGPFDTRIARHFDTKDAIVLYPEIVAGNPLKARHVVRWFMHRPGYHTGRVQYGPDELYFFVVHAFNDSLINNNTENKLLLQWTNPVYSDLGLNDRSGSCYLMRHESGRSLVHDLTDSARIDHLSHEQKAKVFNQTERFYSYDQYTFYLWYAALCGCVPIVVPEAGISKAVWQKNEEDRLGIAYGEDDVQWAIDTRGRLLEKLAQRRHDEDVMVRAFIKKCKEWAGARERADGRTG